MRNKTADLVTQWAAFEEVAPNAEIEDFCRHYLAKKREEEHKVRFSGSTVPPDAPSILAKMLGRLVKLHASRALHVLRIHNVATMDDFIFLNSIATLNDPKKTQVIYSNFNELSSGLLVLGRLKSQGHITERPDKDDRRVKRLAITRKGRTVLGKCYVALSALNKDFYKDIPENEIRECILSLSKTETRMAESWLLDGR